MTGHQIVAIVCQKSLGFSLLIGLTIWNNLKLPSNFMLKIIPLNNASDDGIDSFFRQKGGKHNIGHKQNRQTQIAIKKSDQRTRINMEAFYHRTSSHIGHQALSTKKKGWCENEVPLKQARNFEPCKSNSLTFTVFGTESTLWSIIGLPFLLVSLLCSISAKKKCKIKKIKT